MSLKNSNDIIGNRTRDLTACSAVPQPNNVKIMKYRRLCRNVGEECVLNFGKEASWNVFLGRPRSRWKHNIS